MKIGFIGFGNMAQALVDGLLYQNAVDGEHIYACAKNWDKLYKNAKSKGIIPCKNADELVEKVDMVVIAVKPYLVEEVIEPIKEKLVEKIVVSVVVNFSFDQYEKILMANTHHLSTLPNTPVSVGEGVIICEKKHSLTTKEYQEFENIFSKIGLIQKVETKNMGVAGSISGCGPAFTSMYIEALGDAGVAHGLPRELSYKLASQMIVGTGKLQLVSGKHPGVIKDEVCSPGGTTIVGVTTLERKGLRSAVIDAVNAIQNK